MENYGLGWLKELADNLPEGYPKGTDSEVEENETVLGDVPLELQRLIGIVEHLSDQALELKREHDAKHEDGEPEAHECRDYSQKINLLLEQREVIKDLFWLSLSIRINHHDGDGTIGFRKGWKMVSFEKEPMLKSPKIGGAIFMIEA